MADGVTDFSIETSARGIGETVTVASQVAVAPLEPVTVIMYVVFDVGATVLEPLSIGEILPIPLSIVADIAFEVIQVSVLELPEKIADGSALRVQDGGGGGGGIRSRAIQTGTRLSGLLEGQAVWKATNLFTVWGIDRLLLTTSIRSSTSSGMSPMLPLLVISFPLEFKNLTKYCSLF